MRGYKNCILEVDLGTRQSGKKQVDHETLRRFLGGSGLAGKFLLEDIDPESKCLSENNHIYIMTGPLTGTRFPGTGRFSAVARSPLTGIWCESNCGGTFGPELKFAGYDGIIVKGVASDPVWILIEDDRVEILDASRLWGMNVFEVVDLLEGSLGRKRFKFLSIGPAGENLVKYASVLNGKTNALGRTGLGALMGFKRLKAIAVRGNGNAWRPKENACYEQFLSSLHKKLKTNAFTTTLHRLGTNAGMVTGRAKGDIPAKNWSLGDCNEYAKPLLPYHMMERYFLKNHSCYACPVACKKEVEVTEGPYQSDQGPAPEYETFASFGTQLLIKDVEAIIQIHQTCNKYGLDVISCGNTIAFATELFEKGLIGRADADGLELKWGDAAVVLRLIEKIAFRRGFGDVLADGSRLAATRIGKGAEEFTVEVKGLELPMHDPRAFHGHGLAYAVSNRGACHLQHLVHFVETNNTKHPELGLRELYERHGCEGKAEMTVICEDFGAIMNAAPLCHFVFGGLSGHDLVRMLTMTTGFDYDLQEVRECGQRLWYLKRVINNILGVRVADDRLPQKIMVPLSSGGTQGTVPDMETMLLEYYALRGLDADGIPHSEKLVSTGLYDLISEKCKRLFALGHNKRQ